MVVVVVCFSFSFSFFLVGGDGIFIILPRGIWINLLDIYLWILVFLLSEQFMSAARVP